MPPLMFLIYSLPRWCRCFQTNTNVVAVLNRHKDEFALEAECNIPLKCLRGIHERHVRSAHYRKSVRRARVCGRDYSWRYFSSAELPAIKLRNECDYDLSDVHSI